MRYTIRGALPKKSNDYVSDVLAARGIQDPHRYRYPQKSDLHDPLLLDGVVDGVRLLTKHIKNNSKLFMQVD